MRNIKICPLFRWGLRLSLAAATAFLPVLMIAGLLMLTSCASGVRPTQENSPPPNISIPPGQTLPAVRLPQPTGSDDAALLANHVEVARTYYTLADRFTALVCTITSAAGITINGALPVPPAYCAREPPAGSGDADGRHGTASDR